MSDDHGAYGRGPMLDAIQHLREFNALPADQRAEATARFVEWMMKQQAVESLMLAHMR